MKSTALATALLGATALAGCNLGTTYGTGASHEQQTLNDFTNILSIGAPGRTKTKIDYSARPKLVKASSSALPPPAESVSGGDAYFPVDPEVQRARLRAEGADNGEAPAGSVSDSAQLAALKAEMRERAKAKQSEDRMRRKDGTLPWHIENARVKARGKTTVGTTSSALPATRRYLTQPPTDYRKPAETAPVGVVGEKEVDEKARKKRNKNGFFKNIFG